MKVYEKSVSKLRARNGLKVKRKKCQWALMYGELWNNIGSIKSLKFQSRRFFSLLKRLFLINDSIVTQYRSHVF